LLLGYWVRLGGTTFVDLDQMKDNEGMTPLQLALLNGRDEAAALLRQHGSHDDAAGVAHGVRGERLATLCEAVRDERVGLVAAMMAEEQWERMLIVFDCLYYNIFLPSTPTDLSLSMVRYYCAIVILSCQCDCLYRELYFYVQVIFSRIEALVARGAD
jgi:hypothetical protein